MRFTRIACASDRQGSCWALRTGASAGLRRAPPRAARHAASCSSLRARPAGPRVRLAGAHELEPLLASRARRPSRTAGPLAPCIPDCGVPAGPDGLKPLPCSCAPPRSYPNYARLRTSTSSAVSLRDHPPPRNPCHAGHGEAARSAALAATHRAQAVNKEALGRSQSAGAPRARRRALRRRRRRDPVVLETFCANLSPSPGRP
jgi:hypothetical protein